MTGLPERQQRAKDHWLDERGFWTPIFAECLFVRPSYVERYADLSSHPGDVLDAKAKEFVHLAVNASTSHLYHRGIRSHVGNALDRGASVEEIAEVLLLASTIGLHTSSTGARLLAAAVDEDGEDEDGGNGPGDQDGAGTQSSEHGPPGDLASRLPLWDEDVAALYEADPDHLEHYADLLGVVMDGDTLAEPVKHLVLLAVEIAPTRENERAARAHLENALESGASPEEVLAVVETASVIGVHSLDGMPILLEEAARRGELPETFEGYEEYVTFRDPRE